MVTIQQLLYSDIAIVHNIDNKPNMQSMQNLVQLKEFINSLETLLGIDIAVNSGYRNAKLNELVGGVPNSYHQYGLAADIRPATTNARCTLRDLKKICKSLLHVRLLECVEHDTYIHITIKKY